MNKEELLQKYPIKRIKPVDGTAITAKVWEEAHEYHRQRQELHTLFSRGTGIITGLEVIASDPPDTSVYILPGMAIDSGGQTIVLPEPVSYDVGHDMDGLLYLLLSYGESSPRSNGREEGAPLYIHSEFSIVARSILPDEPYVELARIRRSNRDTFFHNAKNMAYPERDEIDLRFRREVGAPSEVSMAICYLGGIQDKIYGIGVNHLAQMLGQAGHFHISVQDDVQLGPGVVTNMLIYLIGQGDFEMSQGTINGLRNYIERAKGTLLIEGIDPPAQATFLKFLRSVNMEPKDLPSGHRLLTSPYLFAAPPVGFETQGDPQVTFREGIIFSTHNYGLLWQGKRRGQLASREEIRAALEWGSNIVSYAAERRRLSGK